MIGGAIMISSAFLPWVTSDSWWFQSEGNLENLMEKSFHDIGFHNNPDAFKEKEIYQLLGIMMCFLYLIIGGILAFSQVKWVAHIAASLGIAGLFIYTLVTLDFLGAIPYYDIGFGYYTGWIGSILTGLSAE